MRFLHNVSLAPYTTFKIGGPAEYFCQVNTIPQLIEAIKKAKALGKPFFILGGGSNIVVADKGLPGLIIKINLKGIEWHDLGHRVEVVAAAGQDWDELVKMSAQKNLWGLENLSGIPGTVGAAPVQNIGAYGIELKEVLEWLEILDLTTYELRRLSPADCAFSYRDSIFKKPAGQGLVITKVALALKKTAPPRTDYQDVANYIAEHRVAKLTPAVMRQIILEIRKNKFPDLKQIGTAGSFFKNPVLTAEVFNKLKAKFPQLPSHPVDSAHIKIPAAWILDKVCGLNGFRMGEAGLWEKQPLALINHGKATAKEIFNLAKMVKKIVKEKTGIILQEEVSLVGF